MRRSLLSFPTIRSVLAQAHTELEAAWLITREAARDLDSGSLEAPRVNMAKLFVGQVAPRFVNSMMELFAGWGYIASYDIERLLRDVKFYEFVEGPALVQQILISKDLWPLGGTTSSNVEAGVN
jgi:alkylation response protein AidB-like acyl-CoA dehydrogenase